MRQASAGGGEAAPLVPLIGSTRARVEQKSLFYSSHAVHPFVQHISTFPQCPHAVHMQSLKKREREQIMGLAVMTGVLLNVVFHVFILLRCNV